jgi:8-oxo-dGTP diphosphatase
MITSQNTVFKVGLAIIADGRLLLVRRARSPILILPGGKPEPGETELETLQREVHEELSTSVEKPEFFGAFSDRSADDPNRIVRIHLYSGALSAIPSPSSEIADLVWATAAEAAKLPIAPSISNKIIPFLIDRKLL